MSSAASSSQAVLTINSAPIGAEIYLDQNFVGNTPSTLSALPGNHLITVKKNGFQNWSRDLTVSGGTINLMAELNPGTSEEVVSQASKSNAAALPQSSPPTVRRTFQASLVEVRTLPGWIGVSTKGSADGAVVTVVAPQGPAAKAGIMVGDVIQGLNGMIVADMDLEAAIARFKPGTGVVISYSRNAWRREALVTVGKSPVQ